MTVPTDEQEQVRSFVEGLIMATVCRPSERDQQVAPGPSDLADPCDVCVARKIAQSQGLEPPNTSGDFALSAWVGTSIHQKVERDLPGVYGKAEQEITVEIAEIEGLGLIKGHVDLYLPEWRTAADWKTAWKKWIDVYRVVGVPEKHAGQVMLYLYGLNRTGRRVDTASLVYIPRDSNKIDDIYVATCAYREDMALGLLNRARNLTRMVRSGDTSNLVADPDCYVCCVKPQIR